MRSSLLALTLLCVSGGGAAADDAYLRGYARAVLDLEFDGADASVEVSGGDVSVELRDVSPDDAERLEQILRRVEGAGAVAVRVGKGAPEAAPGASEPAGDDRWDFFPRDQLFDPIEADPRWPRFSVAHLWYLGDAELDRVGVANFGESIPLVGGEAPWEGRWELVLLAGVFSIFDLEAESFDLVNTDFMGGAYLGYRRGPFSAMLRAFHQSSHLGDEFLLRNRVDRVNLSFEVVDALLSWDFGRMLRVYGGGGYVVHREPSDLEPGLLQFGAQLEGPHAYWGERIRPLAALDVQIREEGGWDPDWSLRGGLQLERPAVGSLRLQLLFEYYKGRSPNGQFFERDIEYVGPALNLHF